MSSGPISALNQNLLSKLPLWPLKVDQTKNPPVIDHVDLTLFLQQYVGLLQFMGPSASTTINFGTSSTLLLCSWPKLSNAVQSRLSIIIDGPQDDTTPTFYNSGWSYWFDVNAVINGTRTSLGAANMSLILQGIANSSIALTGLPNFKLNYYSDGHLELGVTYASLGASFINSNIYLYTDPLTPKNGAATTAYNYPTLNSTAATTLTASPLTSLTLSTNNGTSWYSWAQTSTASGGTTNGYV